MRGFSLTPSSLSLGAGSATSSVAVGIASGCSWQPFSNDSWLTITSGASGSGSGTVDFSIGVNQGSALRVGTLTVAGEAFNVTQAPPAPVPPTLVSPSNGANPVSLAEQNYRNSGWQASGSVTVP